MRSSPSRRPLFGLGNWGLAALAAGLAVRVGYAAYALSHGLVETSADGYEWIALNLIHGFGYSGPLHQSIPTATREPGFVFLIAGVYKLFGERPLALLATQSLLNVLTVYVLAKAAARASGELAARFALLIGLFYPYYVFYCGYFYRETLLSFVVAAAWFVTGSLLRKPTAALAALAGLAWGLAAVTMSTFCLVSPLVGLWIFWSLLARFRSGWLALLFGVFLAILPGAWLGRNYAVFHRFIPGSTLGGYNLYTSLIVPEEVRGTDQEYATEMADPLWPSLIKMSSLLTDDGRQQEAFLAAAKGYIAAHPGRMASHMVKQALKLWRPYPYERKYAHSYALIKLLSLLSDGWLIPLGLFGLWLLRGRGPDAAAGFVLLAASTLAYAIVSAIVRYRLPMMGVLIAGAAVVLAEKGKGWLPKPARPS